MIQQYENKKAILLGNGVNLLDSSQSVSWGGLLNDLKKRFDINVELDNEFKPFPLGFEEMLHQKSGRTPLNTKLKNLKKGIKEIIDSQLVGKRGYNDYHRKLVQLGYDDILTTNYDYALELSTTPDFKINKQGYALNKLESKFSLKRKYGLPGIASKIWHIHGELYDSRNLSVNSAFYHEESIMIGYEHYTAYLEHIQENIKGKKGKRVLDNQSLNYRFNNNSTGSFWTDIFFTHNLDIIGLGLDFSENHLWWLLNHRASLIRNSSLEIEQTNKTFVNNEIKFYYPDKKDDYTIKVNERDALQNFIKKVNIFNKSKAIAEVLKSFNVIPKPIKCISYTDFYKQFIAQKEIKLS